MVSDHQVGIHQLWMMNGCNAYFLFYSDQIGWVEVWDSEVVIAARRAGRKLKDNPRAYFRLEALPRELPYLFNLRREHDV